ncbi:glycoside hydrolase family 65 protein [Kribbia dieselivorans]|uniref:glycoside hydrolase family 65 protein n=1 Tax=Kribbia dieselivorans TaxID=331526 RepID=UPI0009F8BD27
MRFPVDEWRLVDTGFNLSDLGATETLFSLGNGYLGMRANPIEGRPAVAHGTFINGFHETWPIRHAEQAFGFAKTGQTIVNVPDGKVMKIYVDDEALTLADAELEEYERVLDFRAGTVTRHLVWRTPSGKRVRIDSTVMISFTERHLAMIDLEIEMLDGEAPIVVSSQLFNRQDGTDDHDASRTAKAAGFDPRRAASFKERVLLPRGDWHSERRMILGYETAHSGMTLAVGADHAIDTGNEYSELIVTEADMGKKVYTVTAREGVPVRITKMLTYHTATSVPARELFDRCRRTLDRAREKGAAHYLAEQRAWLDEYWLNTDVVVAGDAKIQQAIRFNLFALAQATARADGLGIAAKGVSGSGYEGHYFWDTEVYVLPQLAYTSPVVARNALRARVKQLPLARERATEMSQRGALFPWRTINGEEASAYYAAGTAQYHIDADVAYAVGKFVEATGDQQFLATDGVDILVETARMWSDLGFWRKSDGRHTFNIHGVTGPDEYTTVVNNNLFTNVMARANLRAAAAAVQHLEATDPQAHARMTHRLDLGRDEVRIWTRCAEGMVIPYDEERGIHPQDDQFLEKEFWDLPGTDEGKRPLLLHYHPLVIYRFQVLKQADVVLALFLQGDSFTAEEKRRNFEYYDPITTGDSSLSAVVQSIIAAEVGYHEMAYDYFVSGLYVDLADLHHNTVDGVHIASAGGVWNALVHGFAGLRDHRGDVSFDPRLPVDWPVLAFPLRVKGTRARIRVEQHQMQVAAEETTTGEPFAFSVRGKQFSIGVGDSIIVPLDGQGPRLATPSFEDHPARQGVIPEDLTGDSGAFSEAVHPESL